MISKEHLKALDSETAKAADTPAKPEGVWHAPKKPAKQFTLPPPVGVSLPHEFHVFHPTEDDCPMDSPVEKTPMDHCKKWYDRCANDMADGQQIKDM